MLRVLPLARGDLLLELLTPNSLKVDFFYEDRRSIRRPSALTKELLPALLSALLRADVFKVLPIPAFDA